VILPRFARSIGGTRQKGLRKVMKPLPKKFFAASDQSLASEAARLWPHREHESSAIKNILCILALHRWHQLDLEDLVPKREVHFCFWCSKVRLDGVTYTP
jgi:hypothetical protein